MKSFAKENQTRQKRKTILIEKKSSLFSSHRTEPKTKSLALGEIVEKFLRCYKSVREPAYRKHKTSSKHIIKFFRINNINFIGKPSNVFFLKTL